MPVDYSKWDALELSDDSDIEVHPNVDKRSFIRAKQNQIHQQRYERKREIETLKYERVINDGLLERINALLDALKSHQDEAQSKDPDQLVFQSLIESAADPAKDEPPSPPEGVYTHAKEPQPPYSKMIASLIDQVKKEVEEKKSSDRYKDYVDGVRGHLTKVQNLQQELLTKLAQLEKEESSKITSEHLHDGTNFSSVTKSRPKEATSSGSHAKPKAKEVELLNPKVGLADNTRERLHRADSQISSGAEADVEDGNLIDQHEDEDETDSSMKLNEEGKQFAKIKMGDFNASLDFIGKHYDEIMNEQTQDGLLVEAFNAQIKGRDAYAKQCVHQGLLIQYCRQLGKDGVGLFFKRVTTKGHQAHTVYINDVNDTYKRIKTRAAELQKQEAEIDDKGGVEQIQLHAVEPGTAIHINVPQPGSSDPVEINARQIFETFPPGLQRALESGSLDKINEVLGKMAVDEAEQVVEKLGEGGMLSLQEGVIDATNEEGQQRLREIEQEEERRKQELGEPGEAIADVGASAATPSHSQEKESAAYDID